MFSNANRVQNASKGAAFAFKTRFYYREKECIMIQLFFFFSVLASSVVGLKTLKLFLEISRKRICVLTLIV